MGNIFSAQYIKNAALKALEDVREEVSNSEPTDLEIGTNLQRTWRTSEGHRVEASLKIFPPKEK